MTQITTHIQSALGLTTDQLGNLCRFLAEMNGDLGTRFGTPVTLGSLFFPNVLLPSIDRPGNGLIAVVPYVARGAFTPLADTRITFDWSQP